MKSTLKPEGIFCVHRNLSIPFENLGLGAIPAWLRAAGTVLLGSAFLALCAHVAIPLGFTPIPLALMPFGVLVLGLLLAPRMALATVLAYLAEGAMGLPVFAPTAAGVGGLAHLFGPTGGYLMAYVPAVVLVAAIAARLGRSFAGRMLAAALGDLTVLACGTAWLAVRTHTSFATAFALAAVPFLPGDALKVAAAAAAGRLRRVNR